MFDTTEILKDFRSTSSKEWPSFIDLFDRCCRVSPDKTFLSSFSPIEENYTYSETDSISTHIASELMKIGIEKGDKVALSGKNSPQWAITYFAILKVSAVAVPIDFQLETERIMHLAEFADVKAFFIDKEKADPCRSIFEHVYILDSITNSFNGSVMPPLENSSLRKPSQDDSAVILFTSGTTGNEKGVMLSHKNIVSNIFMAGHPHLIAGKPDDVYYALLPLHHSYTMTVCLGETVLHGASLIFAKRIVTSQIIKDLKRGKVTMFIGIPLLFNKILKALMKEIRSKGLFVHLAVGAGMRLSGFIKKYLHVNIGRFIFYGILKKIGFTHLRAAICGGGPLSDETFRRYNELGVPFVQGYGLTETSPIITLNPKNAYNYKSVGKALPLVDIRIIDQDDKGVGEVIVNGPNITSGYYKNREATEQLFNDDGYLKTGDVGFLNSKGYLFLTGRKKSLIVTEGGKNVYPEEIEESFQLYQQIQQILVKSWIPDSKYKGESIEAVIYPDFEYYKQKSENASVDLKSIEKDLNSIVEHVNHTLLPYKRISKVTILENPMETTNTQKIKRNEVLKQLNEKFQQG